MNSHCNGGAGLRACARCVNVFGMVATWKSLPQRAEALLGMADAEFQGELERAVFSERGRAAEVALAGKEARIGMANTFEPRSGSCKLQKAPISVCSYRLSTAPQSHSQGEICSALRRLLRSRTDHKKRW